MNICFYNELRISPTSGGIERVTDTIARNLTKLYGCKCYYIYKKEAQWGDISDAFVESEKVLNSRQEIDRIIALFKEWKIDVIINQVAFKESYVFVEEVVSRAGG